MRYVGGFFRKIGYLIYSITNLIYNSSEVRIINFFKSLARDYGHDIIGLPGTKSIPIQLTNNEIAQMTSTSPQRVKSVLKELKAQGMVSFSDKKLILKL